MKYNIQSILGLGLLTSLSFFSCKKDFKNPVDPSTASAGSANFSKYIAIGNSLTAGYADGALYASAQQQSYPVMLAASMSAAGGGEFKVPLMPDNIGGFKDIGVNGKYALKQVNGSLVPVQIDAVSNFTPAGAGGFQNMGVPGAKVAHLLYPGFGNSTGIVSGTANPYFVRFASSPTTSVIKDVITQSPTFFTLWIGNNDVLGYARTGGDGSDPITPAPLFDAVYRKLVDSVLSTGAKGVIANIPSVTDVPFFSVIPYNGAKLSDGQVDTLNTNLASLNAFFNAVDPSRVIVFKKGQGNAFVVKDEALTNLSAQMTAALVANGVPVPVATVYGQVYGQARQAKAGELMPLTASSILGKPNNAAITAGVPPQLAINGITYPVQDMYFLTSSEIAEINTATAAYNTTIKSVATAKNLAFVDAAQAMSILNSFSGMTFNGVNYNAKFVTGGAFSLDGIHPTPRGYAIIANLFIQAINAQYGSSLALKNPNDYDGVTFP